MEVRIKCGKGWEWLLSIVWQFFWAWIYAPYMLWKTRDVHDVHGWRIQTICCCAVGYVVPSAMHIHILMCLVFLPHLSG